MTGNGTHTTYTDGIFEGWSIIVLATLHKVGMALGIDAFLPGRGSFSLRWTTKAEPKKRHAGQLIHLKSARLYSCRLLLWPYSLWILTVRNALKIALNPDTMAGMIRWRNDNTGNNGSHLVAILSDGSDQRCAFCSDIPVPLRGLDRSLQQEPDLKFADKMGWNQSIVDRCNHSCRRDWWNQFIANLNGWKCRMKPWFLAREPRISGQMRPSSNLKAEFVVSTYHSPSLEAVENGDSIVRLSHSRIKTLLGNASRIR